MSNDPVVIKHTASGASASVLPFGASITSFKDAKGHETLFVSKLAKTDGSKATRGGVPLVFPQFGQPNKDMPQHGFLRCNYWKVSESSAYDNETEAGCDFTLDLNDVVSARGDGLWSSNSASSNNVHCSLTLSVKITAMAMTTILSIKNSGAADFDFQTLFHTYYKVYGSKALDKDCCNVVGLSGYNVNDKITGVQSIQGDDSIYVDREVDRIYTPPTGKNAADLVVCTGDNGSKLSIKCSATVGGDEVPISVVVWNPFIEKSKRMSDFDDEEYHDMVS